MDPEDILKGLLLKDFNENAEMEVVEVKVIHTKTWIAILVLFWFSLSLIF